MRRLVTTLAARLCHTYQNQLTGSLYPVKHNNYSDGYLTEILASAGKDTYCPASQE